MSNLKHEEKLQKLFTNVNDWLKFAEAKNLGLLTLTAAIAIGFTQISFQDKSTLKTVGQCLFLPLISVSFFCSLLSLFPILSKIEDSKMIKSFITWLSNKIRNENSFENIHYYGYLRILNESDFESKFLEKIDSTDSFTRYEKELSIQILYISRITWLKYQLFKVGAFIFLCAFVISVILLLIIQICK